VVGVADVVGQVLDQRAAERDVQQLHAAADPEHRQVAFQRAQRQRDLRAVAVGPGVGGLGMALDAVGARVDVRAAGEHQAVEAVEHVVGVLFDPGVGRQHQRDGAGALQRVHVRA
jgi:hypothetical protein